MSQQLTIDQAFASAAKSISNSQSIQSDPKRKQFLRKKRNLEIIERNYLIRRFYYPIRQNSDYEIESKTYSILNHFDFDSPPYNKFSSIKNFSANAFWFLICSNYFPYYSNELIDQKECLPEELKKLLDYIVANNINISKKNSGNLSEKFSFLRNLKNIVNFFIKKKNNSSEKNNLFQINTVNNSNSIDLNENKPNINISNLSCNNNISSIKTLLENLIKYIEHYNENKIPNIIKNDFLLNNKYNRDDRVEEDFELDLKYHTKSFQIFKEEILNKVEQIEEEEENDDVVCYVCGDGEYEDDNLIIFCSKCNITVHQKCYGVLVIPEEDWICHLCRAFNDINICNNMECILCPNLGGAMKPCTLRKTSHSYKVMMKNRLLDKNRNNNNNLNTPSNNSFSNNEEIKGDKGDGNNNNSNINNKSESNLYFSEISGFQENSNLNHINTINSSININPIQQINNSDLNSTSNNNNNNILTNSINNESNTGTNLLEHSPHSSNVKNDTDSLYSNSSANKNNSKEEENNNKKNHNHNKHKIKSQKSKVQNEIYLSEKISKENAWVHLSCALWLPELNIGNFELKEKIKGVENLPKKRLQEKCDICLTTGYGPTIKCEKCFYRFHPECARRLKVFFLEVNENENGDTSFLAYCNRDAPPRNLKKYELMRQRKKDEIKKFSQLLRKDISSLSKIPEDKQCNIKHPYCYNVNPIEMKKIIDEEKKIFKKKGKKSILNEKNMNDILFNESVKKGTGTTTLNNYDKKIELTITEKKCLINAIRDMLIDESNLTLEINSEDYSIVPNKNNIQLTYDDMQYPEKFSWCFLKENQYYLNGISNFETFKIFKSLISNVNEYAKTILREKLPLPEKPKKQKNKQKQSSVNLDNLCWCKNYNISENWIACDNKNGKCPGNGWYHIECLPELKNFTLQSFEKHFDLYYCPQCREKFSLTNTYKNSEEIDKNKLTINPEENIKITINEGDNKKDNNINVNVNINININNNENKELNLNKENDRE